MNTRLSPDTSRRISAARCILMVMIIYCHAYNLAVYSVDTTPASYITIYLERIFYGINKYCCDALFFVISGYLLFLGFEKSTIKRKLTSRIRTLVIPFIVWNALYWLFWCLVGKLLNGVDGISNAERYSFSFDSFLNAFIGTYPADEPLWFLRHLIIMVCISPVLWLIIRNRIFGAIFLVGVAVACNILGLSQDSIFNTLYYFGIGSYLVFHGRTVVESSSLIARGIAVMILIANVVWTVIDPMNDTYRYSMPEITLVIIALWILTGGLEWGNWVERLAGYSFFVFASHSIVLESLEKIWFIMLGDRPIFALMDYTLMPILTLTIVLLAGMFIKRFIPFLWTILNGGR